MVSRACKASATCIRVLISSLYCLEGTLGLTVLRYWAFFKRYFGNLNLNVRYYDITRYHLVPRYEVFLPLGWRYSVKELIFLSFYLSRYYRRTDCRNMGSSDCWRVTWRVEIGQNSAFMSLSRLVGCFHIDFGAKILTISSFHSLKRALIWNNMLTLMSSACPRYGIWSLDSKLAERVFASKKRSITFTVLKLVLVNVVF